MLTHNLGYPRIGSHRELKKGARIARYFPSSLTTLAFYVAVAAIVHAAFGAVRLSGARDRRALGGN